MEANQALRARFSSSVSTTLEDAGIANTDINSSIDRQYLELHICMIITLVVVTINVSLQVKLLADSLQLDHEACGNLNSMITPCCGDLTELKGGHYNRIVEITENAGKCLLNEYMVRKENSCAVFNS